MAGTAQEIDFQMDAEGFIVSFEVYHQNPGRYLGIPKVKHTI
jgi:hypothetical protein